jgi:predicted nuclease of predicted toxin-antitoxin system
VKLLFDEISPRLVESLSDVYPLSVHVHECHLGSSDDVAIWEYAKARGFTVVSKDSDFQERNVRFGSPGKAIRFAPRTAPAPNSNRLRTAFQSLKKFIQDDAETCLILGNQARSCG